jgi:hypothetical protein
VADLDLKEVTRRDYTYAEINRIIDALSQLDVFPSLVWVYTWDIVKDKLDSYHAESGEDYIVNSKLSEKDVWDLFWEDIDKNSFSLEYGIESLHEAVFDWMLDRDIIVVLDEDGWLE